VPTTCPEPPGARSAAAVNLILPGGGMILIGAVWRGLLVGMLFAACANFAVVATLLFPDEYSRLTRLFGIGLAVGGYLGAQVRFAQTVRGLRQQGLDDLRRRCLRQARELLLRGSSVRALEQIQPLAELVPDDLHVAYRLAQALTATGDVAAARAAWRRLGELDRHGVYRREVQQHERGLGRVGMP
jgi:hypothetical protein